MRNRISFMGTDFSLLSLPISECLEALVVFHMLGPDYNNSFDELMLKGIQPLLILV